MMLSISEFIERIFSGKSAPASGTQVKQRLKFILAHDRAAISPQMFAEMRQEIMAIVSRYVEIDQDSLDIRLESDSRFTALVANLPIKAVKTRTEDFTDAEPMALELSALDNLADGLVAPENPEPTDAND